MKPGIPKHWTLFGIPHVTTIVDGPLDAEDSALADYKECNAEIRMCKGVEDRPEIFYHELVHAMLTTFNVNSRLNKQLEETICDVIGIGFWDFLSRNEGLFEEANDG